MQKVKAQVNDSLTNNLIPIIASTADIVEDGAFATWDETVTYFTQYWVNMTKQFKGISYKVVFNIWNQISGNYKNATQINNLYASVLNGVRAQDTFRILIFSPIIRSHPNNLVKLSLPSDDYTMIEWHYYGSGPSDDPSNKQYWKNGQTKI